MHQVVIYLTQVVSQISPLDMLIVAGALATGIQYLINQVKPLHDHEQWLVSFILPALTALLPFMQAHQKHFGTYFGLAYFAAQLIFFGVQQLKGATQDVPAPATQF